jgi:FAD/FMN-containing dehydrogenase
MSEVATRTERPETTAEVLALVADANEAGRRLEVIGGGTKRSIGRVTAVDAILSLAKLDQVVDYAPEELVLTGEHGVGVEKRDLMGEMFNETDLACQQRVKCAFDPDLLLNPGKVFPRLHRCAELGRVHVHRGQVAFPELPRF